MALTPYTPTTWVNDSEPDLEADNLNKIEQGIASAIDGVNGILNALSSQIEDNTAKFASSAALYAVNNSLNTVSTNLTALQGTVSTLNSNLGNKANIADIIDKVRLTGTVLTATDTGSLFGYSGDGNISLLSGYPSGKEIIAVVPVVTYSSTNAGLIYTPSTNTVRVTAKIAATFTYVVDVLYKRG